MPNLNQTIDRSLQISRSVATVFERRMRDAARGLRRARPQGAGGVRRRRAAPATRSIRSRRGRTGSQYGVDFAQRSVLFWDTLRQRGNNWIAHEAAGKPPVLAYRYEVLADGAHVRAAGQPRAGAHHSAARRRGRRPASARSSSSIRAPATARASAASRRTPRSASRCRAGHPVYFVIFYPRSRARADARRRHRRRSRVRPHRRRAPSATARSRCSSAIARAAGR